MLRKLLNQKLARAPVLAPKYSRFFHPLLRTRAEQLRMEFNTLNEEIANDYQPELAIRLARLAPTVEEYEKFLAAEQDLVELKELLNDESLGEEARLELGDAQKTLQTLEEKLESKLVPQNPFVDKACLLEIRPGIGGSEAAIFAADLLQMYQNYALKKGWAFQCISSAETPNGGVTEAILHIKEPGSYARLQYEGGVHRVQRVPDTETKGRVHTSTAGVVVLPDMGVSEVDPEREFKAGELRIDVMRASGSGGQHVNTTESAVRIVHLETNLVVICQDERSQHKNKAKALMVLKARLAERERAQKQKDSRAERNAQVSSTERSDKVRTYNYPQNRVTDHRCGYSGHHLSEIMAGHRFDEVVDSCEEWSNAEKVRELTESS